MGFSENLCVFFLFFSAEPPYKGLFRTENAMALEAVGSVFNAAVEFYSPSQGALPLSC